MGKKVDGNFQDMSVHDKNVAALAATEEAQDMSTLNRVVVPVAAFTDPNNPSGAAASVNLDLDESPFEHSDDYGRGVLPGAHSTTGPEDTHAKEAREVAGHPGRREAAARTPNVDYPESREDWTKAHWQAKAGEYGLAKSGNTDAVKGRVEEHESTVEEAKNMSAEEWKDEIDAAETEADLNELRALYDAADVDYSTVAKAFETRAAEINEQ